MATLDAATLAPRDFENALQQALGTDVNRPQPGALPTSVAPETQAALADTSAQLQRITPDQLSEAAREMGLRQGVQFNPLRGAPLATRARLSFDEKTINQFNMLASKYGPENVTQAPNGRFVIQNQLDPTTGRPEDFYADPLGFEAGDVAGFASNIAPTIIGAVGARLGGGATARPLLRHLTGIAGAVVGTESTQALETAADRWLESHNIDPKEIAGTRTKSAILNASLGVVLAGGTKLGGQLLGIGRVPSGAEEAVNKLRSSTGVTYPLTPGELTESPLLMRIESVAKPRIGSAGVMDVIEQGKQKAQDELRRSFLDLPRNMSDEEVVAALPKADVTGQRVLGELRPVAEAAEAGVARAKGTVEQLQTGLAQSKAGVDLANPLPSIPVGSALRAKAVGDMAAFKDEMARAYAAFDANPEITERIVDGTKFANLGKAIRKELLPQATKTVETEAGPVDITRPASEFVAGSVKRVLAGLSNLRDARVGIKDLQRIRTSIDDAIAEGVSIPGTDVKQLTTLRQKFTDAMRTELNDLDPALTQEWDRLNKAYATGISRFDKNGIRELLVKEGQPGAVGNAEIALGAASGQPRSLDLYNDYKTFFGAASPEFQNLQRLTREKVLKGSLSTESGYITGNDLANRLKALDPEVAADIFGSNKQDLDQIATLLKRVQGANLDTRELAELASRRGGLTQTSVEGLIDAERDRIRLFNNKLIKTAAKGELDAEVTKPSMVVRGLSQMDPDDAAKVLGALSHDPALLQDVRQLATEDLLSRAATLGKEAIAGRRVHWYSAKELEQALGSEVQHRTWKMLLGPKVTEDISTLARALQPQEFGTEAFRGAGKLASAVDVNRIEKGGVFNVMAEAGVRMALAVAYTSGLKNLVINLASKNELGNALNAMIASTPFIERVADTFGPEAPAIMRYLKGRIQTRQEADEQSGKDAQHPGRLDPTQFEKLLQQATTPR